MTGGSTQNHTEKHTSALTYRGSRQQRKGNDLLAFRRHKNRQAKGGGGTLSTNTTGTCVTGTGKARQAETDSGMFRVTAASRNWNHLLSWQVCIKLCSVQVLYSLATYKECKKKKKWYVNKINKISYKPKYIFVATAQSSTEDPLCASQWGAVQAPLTSSRGRARPEQT